MIDLPALIIVGAFDSKSTPQQMRTMHQKIKNSDFAIAPRAGHLAPLENPEFVNQVIEGFLMNAKC
jgi:pimeloyl-ACP methyl ester carboxylesterase